MSGFDEKCPHCGVKIDCHAMWSNTDHQSNFQVVCGECDGILEITVHMVPEFETDFCRCPLCDEQIDGTRHYCSKCEKELKALK